MKFDKNEISSEHTMRIDRSTLRLATEEASSKLRPALLVLQGLDRGDTVTINETPMVLGRGESCDFPIRDDGISRQHAQIVQDQFGRYMIEDLGSTNGIFVNRERVSTHVFKEGDKVLVGRRTVLKFVLSDEFDRKYQQQMYESAVKDGLTGVFNRKHFDDRFTSEMSYALRHKSSLSVLIFDLDHFKRVNDTFGHLMGDHVLTKVAKTISGTLREEDFMARYGGEEFVILARDVGREGAHALGERIRRMVQHLIIKTPEGIRVPVTMSIGVATFEGRTDSCIAKEVLDLADSNLYRAKDGGRNRVIAT